MPETTVTAVATCVANIFGSHLELTDVSGNENYLSDPEAHYHPKNSGRERFVFCCAGFAQKHNPTKDDLLVVSITDIKLLMMDGKEIFKYVQHPEDRFDLLLEGESLFKGYEDRF